MKVSENLLEQVAAFFEPAEITRETEFVADLNATSSEYMYIIGTIQDLTGKKVSYSKMKACKTVGDALDLCDSLATE